MDLFGFGKKKREEEAQRRAEQERLEQQRRQEEERRAVLQRQAEEQRRAEEARKKKLRTALETAKASQDKVVQFENYLIAAELGDAQAMDMVGTRLVTGYGAEQDLYQAAIWLKKAADAGCNPNRIVLYKLVDETEKKVAKNEDYAWAFKIWKLFEEEKAEMFDSIKRSAYYNLAKYYGYGLGVEEDGKKALDYIEKAGRGDEAERLKENLLDKFDPETGKKVRSDNAALCNAKNMMKDIRDRKGAYDDVLEAAAQEANDPRIKAQLERLTRERDQLVEQAGAELFIEAVKAYHDGHMEAVDQLLQESGKMGNAEADYFMGMLFESGEHYFGQSDQFAVWWYDDAAERGHKDAAMRRAYLMIFKQGKYYDAVQKAKDAEEAGMTGVLQETLDMLDSCARKKLQEGDNAAAFLCSRYSAWGGSVNGMGNYAMYLLIGKETKPDYNEAERYARSAAEKGGVAGMVVLAQLYNKGLGVHKDPVLGAEWMQKAIDLGYGKTP